MNEFYIFVTPDNIIWGVGQTKKEAVEDALKCIECDVDKPTHGKIIRASEDLAMALYEDGYCDDMWELYKDGERWLAVIKEHNLDNYSRLTNIKETKLKY